MSKILNSVHQVRGRSVEGDKPLSRDDIREVLVQARSAIDMVLGRMDASDARRKKRTGGSAPDVPEMQRGPQGQRPKAAAARREYQRHIPEQPGSYKSSQADDGFSPG